MVFWQTDEHDQPAIVTERYEKAFSAANIAREQAFYDSELKFRIKLKLDTQMSSFRRKPESRKDWMPPYQRSGQAPQVRHDEPNTERKIAFSLPPPGYFCSGF